MKSPTLPVHWLIVAILAASSQAANADMEAEVDMYTAARIQCLQDRATGAIGAASSDRCHHLSAGQSVYMRERQREFCSNPDQFCESVQGSNADERLYRFVNHSCQPATRHESFDNDLMFFMAPSGEAEGNSALGPTFRRLWGCAEGDFRVGRRGSSGASLTLSYSCDPARVPFRCGSSTSGTGSARANRVARQFGATITENGDRCQINFSTQLPSGWPRPPAEGVQQSRYAAGLSADQRAALEGKVFDTGTRGNRLFEATGSIIGAETEVRRGVFRQAFTPENMQMVRRMLTLAKNGLDRYLNDIGAPASIRNTVSSTQLEDYDFLLGPRPGAGSERERYDELWAEVNESCGQSSADPLGHDNAHCSRHARRDYKIMICPAALVDALQGNPASLISLFGHELGHSIDACDMGMDLSEDISNAGRGPNCELPESVSRGPEFRFFNERVEPFTRCLYSNSTMPARRDDDCDSTAYRDDCRPGIPMVRPMPRLQMNRLLTLLVDDPGCPLRDLQLPSEGGTGLRATCSFSGISNLAASMRSRLDERRSRMSAAQITETEELLTEVERNPQNDQTGESMADYFSAQASAYALSDPGYPWPPGFSPGEPDRAAEIMTSVSHVCNWSTSRHNEHPLSFYRMSLIASSPRLRSEMGCASPVPAAQAGNGNAFPSASCTLARPASTGH